MLCAVVEKFWKQHLIKQLLYGHLYPISEIILVKQTRHVELCWKGKIELKSDVLLKSLTHGQASAGRPADLHSLALCSPWMQSRKLTTSGE